MFYIAATTMATSIMSRVVIKLICIIVIFFLLAFIILILILISIIIITTMTLVYSTPKKQNTWLLPSSGQAAVATLRWRGGGLRPKSQHGLDCQGTFARGL